MEWRNFIYGFPGDSLGYLVYLHNFLTQDLLFPGYFKSLFWPNEPQQTVLVFLLTTPALVFGPIRAFNLVVLLTFLANFISIFFVARRFLSHPSSIVTSVLLGSSLYVQWQATRSLELAMLFWLPWIFWFWLKFWREGGYRNIVVLAFLVSVQFLTSFYLGYFCLLLAFWLGLLRLGRELLAKRLESVIGSAGSLLTFAILFFVLTLPATHPLLSSDPLTHLSRLRQTIPEELIAYGARPWDYLSPSIYHPLFGPLVRNFYESLRQNFSYQFWSTYLPDRANYLTLTGFFLAAAAPFLLKRQKTSPPSLLKPLLLVLFFSFWLSLPSVVHFRGLSFFGPSFFLKDGFPVFRVYARAGALVLVAVAFLAGLGWEILLAKIRKDFMLLRIGRFNFPARKSVLLTTAVVGLIIFENLNFPPWAITDLNQIPPVYGWLKERKESGQEALIIEYPKDNTGNDYGGGCPKSLAPSVLRDYNGIYEDYFQTIHGMAIFDYQQLAPGERAKLPYLDKRESHEVLKKYQINYVVIHSRESLVGVYPWPYPQENPLDECWQRRIMKKPEKVYEGFKKVAEFDDGVVYRVK